MAQKQDELLDESHLDEEKSETEQEKIPAHAQTRAVGPAAFDPGKRNQDQDQPGNHGLQQRRHQDQVAPLNQARAPCLAQRHDFRKRRPLEEVKIVGPVIGGRFDLKFVAFDIFFCMFAEQRLRAVIQVCLFEKIETVRVVCIDRGEIGSVEGTGIRKLTYLTNLLGRKLTVPDQQGAGIPATYRDEPLSRIADTIGTHRLYRRGDELQAVARRQLEPTGNCNHAARRRVRHVLAERLDRVDIALVQ